MTRFLQQVMLGAVLAATVLVQGGFGQLLPRFRHQASQRIFTQQCTGPTCTAISGTRYTITTTGTVIGLAATPQTTLATAACPPYQVQQLSTPEGVEQVASAVADGPYTRALVSGSCGSGTICGADAGGAFVLSNAHVWGTAIGKQVTIDIVADGQMKRLTGRTVFAGYSNSRMVDFCIAYFEGLSSKRYMQLLKTEPESPPYETTGSPRCVWPLVTKQFNDPKNYGQGLLTGTPDAIGGQSGSAIYNNDKRQIALLTWSINSRCAGQKTSKLWEVASQRNVNLADVRPDGLKELYAGENRPETQEGVFGELPEYFHDQKPELAEGIFGEMPAMVTEVSDYDGADDGVAIVGQRMRPITENTISSIVSANLEDMPIWYTPGGGGGPVDPPVDPTDPDCRKLTAKEWELIQFIRAQQNEAAFGDALKNIDWVKLAKTIIEIIKLFQSMQ
jgi:hypothetical protein